MSHARGLGLDVNHELGRDDLIRMVDEFNRSGASDAGAVRAAPEVVEVPAIIQLGGNVIQPEAEPVVPGEAVTFVCVPYPTLTVETGAWRAVFSGGYLTTADPLVIAKLDSDDLPDVRRANELEIAARIVVEPAFVS